MQATADRAGVSAGYQFKLEGGFVRTPSPRVLHRISGVLELSYAELMKLAGYPDDTTPAPSGDPSRDILVPGDDDRVQATDSADGEPAPTNRRIIGLLEEIRRDVAAVREDLRRLEAAERAASSHL